MKTKISFDVSRFELKVIGRITDRAMAEAKEAGVALNRQTVMMDLMACHANGCPLKLDELEKAPGFDFAHDVFGIMRHMDRTTGKLGGCFVPRYAMPEVGA